MAETFKFDPFSDPSDPRAARSPHCFACEEMLADALDQTLSDADQAFFDRHLATCAACSNSMADAQRGAAWLELLKAPRPEPSAHLMERILAQTTGAQTTGAQTTGAGTIRVPHSSQPYRDKWVPATTHVVPLPIRKILPFRLPVPHINVPHINLPRFTGSRFEPRLAMTAAMAFFSLALTLNLTGVKLNQLHASDLKPSSIKRAYFEANAQASRYYSNLRVVHVMESRVEDLRQANADARPDSTPERQPETLQPESAPAPGSQPKPAPDNQPKPGPGVSRREAPQSHPQFLLTDQKLRRSGDAFSTRQTNKEGGLA